MMSVIAPTLKLDEGHHVFQENRKGINYDKLCGPYIDGAHSIIITNPYIGLFC
jgi:ATP-dependent Lon protease